MKNKSTPKNHWNVLIARKDISKHTKRIRMQRIAIVMLALCGLLLYGCSNRAKDLRSLGYTEPLADSQLIELSVDSNYMNREMPCLIYLPKGYNDKEEYPVWYGLHGYSSNETMWVKNEFTKEADELIEAGEIEPLIMVFPFVKDASFKEITADFEDDGKFEERNIDKFINEELVPYIDTHYFTEASAKGRSIGGFSMGGMIALRIAFHHTDRFHKVGGYSAAVTSTDYSDRQLEEWLFPNNSMKEVRNLKKFDHKKGFDKLKVYLDAGNSNDPFSEGLQSLYDALQNRGIKSEFHLQDGGHTLRPDQFDAYLRFYAAED